MKIQNFIDKYYLDRRGTNSAKWDAVEEIFNRSDLIPMWIADMDFKLAEPIVNGLKDFFDTNVPGYSMPMDDFFESYATWLNNKFNFTIEKDWVSYANGTVEAISHLLQIFTNESDSVVVLSPVYGAFASIVNDTQRKLVQCPLIETQDSFRIDFENFERLIINNHVKAFISCSPHNPVGRVWTEYELAKLFAICQNHGVLVISDEIHQDFVFNDHHHIPAPLVSKGAYRDQVITLNSCGKSFNMSRMAHANVIIINEKLRNKYTKFTEKIHSTDRNTLNFLACQLAYSYGQEWIEACCEVIYHNYLMVKEAIEKISGAKVFNLEGTYLCFVNLQIISDQCDFKDFIINQCKIGPNFGDSYDKAYAGYIRLNLATHPKNIKTVMDSLLHEYGKLLK